MYFLLKPNFIKYKVFIIAFTCNNKRCDLQKFVNCRFFFVNYVVNYNFIIKLSGMKNAGYIAF